MNSVTRLEGALSKIASFPRFVERTTQPITRGLLAASNSLNPLASKTATTFDKSYRDIVFYILDSVFKDTVRTNLV